MSFSLFGILALIFMRLGRLADPKGRPSAMSRKLSLAG
jgi:hypothetical protein